MRWLPAVALLAGLAACGRMEQPLPVYGQVPRFELTAESGEPFDSAKSLDGNIWIADFIFTTCTGPCPRMSAQMRQVQNATAGTPGIRLVSFTVDPEHDTPPVLAEYAKRYHADPQRWHFLTGPTPKLQDLCRNAFKLGDVDGSLVHSTRFVLMDGRGHIRGYYGMSEDDSVSRLLRDVRKLSVERS